MCQLDDCVFNGDNWAPHAEPRVWPTPYLKYVLSDGGCWWYLVKFSKGVISLLQNIFMSNETKFSGNPEESYNFKIEICLSLGKVKQKAPSTFKHWKTNNLKIWKHWTSNFSITGNKQCLLSSHAWSRLKQSSHPCKFFVAKLQCLNTKITDHHRKQFLTATVIEMKVNRTLQIMWSRSQKSQQKLGSWVSKGGNLELELTVL